MKRRWLVYKYRQEVGGELSAGSVVEKGTSLGTAQKGNQHATCAVADQGCCGVYDGVLEPSKKFTERHQLLLAHSVVHCSGNNTVVQISNPTLQPVVLHVHEVVGHFYPLSKEDQVCSFRDCAKVPEGSRGRKLVKRQRSSMIWRLMADIEGLSPEQTSKLHKMLRGYADVISQNDGDLGKPTW